MNVFDREERSSCGVGFLVNRRNDFRHEILRQGLKALQCVEHRGACAADQMTGDGAGIMTDIPFELLGFTRGTVAVATLFMPQDHARMRIALKVFEETFRFYGLDIVGYREIPTDTSVLGDEARRTLPSMTHCFIARPQHCRTESAFERVLYAAKQRTRTEISRKGINKEFFFTSLSASTIIYKGLLRGEGLDRFYLDLQDSRYRTRFALAHRRFSTNTRSTWDKAQPFRIISHNGEINTIAGNRSWALSREMSLGLPKDQLLTHAGISDSGSLNEMVEALMHRSSIPDIEDILAIMMPPAHDQNDFYKYWSRAMEPWDGPAIILYADGKTVGARLDRHGFRPARWTVTDDMFYLASEAGTFEVDESTVRRKGALHAGTGVKVDLVTGRVHFRDPSRSGENRGATFDPRTVPVGMIDIGTPDEQAWRPAEPTVYRQNLFSLTREEHDLLLVPMIVQGKEPVGSMGDTARPNVFSTEPRPFYDYFYQNFAQVTNPPLDYMRERNVTDLRVFLGRKPNIFFAKDLIPLEEAIEAPGPVLKLGQLAYLESLRTKRPSESHVIPRVFDMVFERSWGTLGLKPRLDELEREVRIAVEQGCSLIILTDRTATVERPPIPALVALRAVVRGLNDSGLRLNASIVVETAEVRTPHHVAALIAFGASAVCPSLALSIARQGDIPGGEGLTGDQRESNLVAALESGLLKIMSKSGISVVQSYQSSKLFTAIGLGPELMEDFFPGQPTALGGIGPEELAEDILWKTGLAADPGLAGTILHTHLFREHNALRQGERHSMTSKRAASVHKLLRKSPGDTERREAYEEYLRLGAESEPVSVRHLFSVKPVGPPIHESDVQPTRDILSRFGAGAMSYGAVSAEVQRDIIIAMRELGARSNSGEGGENPYYFTDGSTASVKQVASARFGVTAEYLVVANEIQIKIAQGAKPGEGGQLMGVKVDESIARARHADPGVDLISPPPLHDIYSIEDLKELIYELRQVHPAAKVSVKLVSGANIGTVAVGVVKAGADIIYVAGGDGGTGAATLGSMKHAGLPWEFGLMEVHRVLVENNLRSSVELRTDGGLLTGSDVVRAAILGAEGFDFGKLLLVAVGCIMARICEKNTCPTGIATHDPKFKAKYKGSKDDVVAVLTAIAGDVRTQLASLGVRDLRELVGKTTLLEIDQRHRAYVEQRKLDLSFFLQPVPAASAPAYRLVPEGISPLNRRIAEEVLSRLDRGETRVDLSYQLSTSDRGVLGTLSGRLAGRTAERRRRGETPGPPGGNPVRLTFKGSTGQGFGAFLEPGLTVNLFGETNDGLCKSMSGGLVTVAPLPGATFSPEENAIVGNCALYGATGGEVFINGLAGDRFAVRNSGATAVVEGAGLHACEYMTRGTIVILGPVSYNVGAGMTGGVLYIRRTNEGYLNRNYIQFSDLDAEDEAVLAGLLRRQADCVGSATARLLLERWDDEKSGFIRCGPPRRRKSAPGVEGSVAAIAAKA
jgi:glutamate synthase domain-containing protein 2/glutamate synthase domain-containing protein 1/glutamate synthase domain-containing protein 3